MKGLRHNAGDVVGVLDQIAVLGKGGHSAGDVDLLENVPAQQMAGDLAGNSHHGNGVQIGSGNAGEQVGGSRAGGDHADPHLAGDPVIAGGHVPGVLLRPHQGVADLWRLGQYVHRGADGGSGIAEDMFYTCPL